MHLPAMSTREIIAELPRLGADDLALVKSKVEEVLKSRNASAAPGSPSGGFLLQMAGTVDGLPADLAENHDHYLYGTPRRSGT